MYVCVKAGLLLDDCSFGAPCCCEHDPGGEADSQVLLLQAQQLGTVLQRLTRLVLDGAATWKTKRRANISPSDASRTKRRGEIRASESRFTLTAAAFSAGQNTYF